jgi:hypothetical protein
MEETGPRGRSGLFYASLLGLTVFEVLRVYFIMPMPGSQQLPGLDFAYFLHIGRWGFRILLGLGVAVGAVAAFRRGRKWLMVLTTALALSVIWLLNFRMSADQMFKMPASLHMTPRAQNSVDEDSVIIGIERNGEARAYPVRFLVYHHQVQDTIGGVPALITYCSVCRSGRVFSPLVDGQLERFRLVGMDRFNAMLEDATTGSWWRQATGRAVTGPRKGAQLADLGYRQVTLRTWFAMHPNSLVMQLDEAAREKVDATGRYERGESRGDLTRTDRDSWQEKSWVLGVEVGAVTKAYDWNRLSRDRIINDQLGGKAIVLAIAEDGKSFAAFERPQGGALFTIDGDALLSEGVSYGFDGRRIGQPEERLAAIAAHQEFWHSWRTFHPDTLLDR